jgi:hypothetical protein
LVYSRSNRETLAHTNPKVENSPILGYQQHLTRQQLQIELRTP